MKKKHFKAGLLVISLVIGMTAIGCASYTHFQSIRNETNNTIMRVFIRDTGTTDWGGVKNVRARRDSDGVIIRRQDGSIAYYDEFTMNNGTQVVFFQETSNSETPKSIKNKDIRIIDNNNISYTKINVPIHFSTSKKVDILIISLPDTTITSSEPIVFTVQDRDPMMTVLNNTGFPVRMDGRTLTNGGSISMQIRRESSQGNLAVNYSINDYSFSKEVNVSASDTTVILTERPPILTVINNTGFSVSVTRPFRQGIENGERIEHAKQSRNVNSLHIVSYQIGNASYEEQVTLNEADATVTLTKRPATITIVNNTGTGNNINIIQFRSPGSVAWIGGNIAIRNNELYLTEGTAQSGVTTQVLTNGERLRLWLGNISIQGNAFDIRLQTPSDTIFQKDNVRITGDTTLTFSQSDKR